nr:hypothetical protein [Tanacetum cinerariifolium]
MRPFGCPVTILNTIDHLCKFDGKVDEGFLVGYSLNSKAVRVFNSRTRIVEENLHIRFSESTPNVVGTQSNGFAGTKANDNADNVNSTDNVNIVSSTVNVAGTNEDNKLTFDPNMTALEDVSIFNFLSDDEDVGTMADMNNLDTTIQVSHIPTTRIHKDHPFDQVIRDLQSAIQTRKMSKNLKEHGLLVLFNKEQTIKTFKTTCLLTFYHRKNPKRAIGTKWVFKNKKDERRIMIRNKARLLAQGYTQEEGIAYDEGFASIARIKAIRLFLAYASFKDFVVYQMDVKSAFLYGIYRIKNPRL